MAQPPSSTTGPAAIERLSPNRPVTVIGAGFVDVAVSVARLPESGGDQLAQPRRTSAGGCGLNVARALARLGIEVVPGIPVGDGIWSDIVRSELRALGLDSPLQVTGADNGWCLAMVEPDGERTFISIPGVERQLTAERLARVPQRDDSVLYVSGHELLGDSGADVRDWMSRRSWAACLVDIGPRLASVTPSLLRWLGERGAIVGCNREEARALCGSDQFDAVDAFAERFGLTVIHRLGAAGARLCRPGQSADLVAARPVAVVDTIGAGDAHSAGCLAALACDWSLPGAVWLGNQVAAYSVAHQGADGTPELQALRAFVC